MAAGFRIRAIRSAPTLGERLKKARLKLGVTIEQAEEATKIRMKFLSALETDAWEHIPSEAYGRGYLETYAAYLKLPAGLIAGEFAAGKYAVKCRDGVRLAPPRSFQLPRFTLTPPLLTGLSLGLCAAVIAGFLGLQIKRYASAPFLEVVSAAADGGPVLSATADKYTVSGRTAPGSTVTVNGVAADVDEDGRFAYPVPVRRGVNAVLVSALGANGRRTEQVMTVTGS